MTSQDNRKAKRRPLRHTAMIYSDSGQRLATCELRNVSATGAQLEMQQEINLPPRFILSLSIRGVVRRRCVLVWQFSTVVGVKFVLDG